MKKKHKYIPLKIKTPNTTSTIEALVIWDDKVNDWMMTEQSLRDVELAKCTQRLKELCKFELMVGFHESSDDFFMTFSPVCGHNTTIFNLTAKDLKLMKARINEALKEKRQTTTTHE
jgi:hypothetical protein